MALADLTANLRLNISNFTGQLNSARRSVQRFSSAMAAASHDASAASLVSGYDSLNKKLHSVGLGFRDIARIASGITISQTFYGITRSIREASDALSDFIEQLDYANITYSALFGDSELASNFLDTLKQFSIDTIFEYSDLEGMARKLSAYGIEYKNLMYIIEGLTNLGTISGDAAALERLAVALGQINAKGKLSAEEVRQLANAYVPINDILREKLGVTEEGFKSIGDLGISSVDAINAIIEYANETFGGVGDAAVFTITGLKNKIVDTLKVMGEEMMQPITTFYKSLLVYVSDSLNTIYDVYRQSGLGGVFEHLVPDEGWQQRLRQLIANLSNLIRSIVAIFQSAWPTIQAVFGGLLDAFNLVISIAIGAATQVVAVMQYVANNTPLLNILTKALITAAAAWIIFKAQALGAAVVSALSGIITGVAKAVLLLAQALTAHPIITLFVLLGAAMIGVGSSANSANSAIGSLMDTLGSYSTGGTLADDILQIGDAAEQSTANSDQFWESMSDGAADTSDALDDIGSSAGNAGKAADKARKSLLSFDEVFRLNEDLSSAAGSNGGGGLGSGLGDLGGIGDLASGLGGLGASLIPEIPDLSSYAKNFVNTLYNDLWEAIKTIGSGAATGALIGGLVGFAIGGLVTKTISGAMTGAKWGAKIGTIAGAGFAGFWTDTYKEMEDSLKNITIGGSLGTLVGGLVGLVVGAFSTRTLQGALEGAKWGAGIGGLIGAGVGSFWSSATNEMDNAIEGLMVGGGSGALVGALAGFVFGAFSTRTLQGALEGAKWGAGIGGAIGGTVGAIFGSLSDTLQQKISAISAGSAVAALLGGFAGFVVGAFATRTLQGAMTGAKYGALIGSAIGGTLEGVFGDVETTLGERINTLFAGVTAASTGSLIGALAGMIIGAVVGAFVGGIGAIPGAKAGASIGAAMGALAGTIYSYLETTGLGDKMNTWFGEVSAKAIQGISDTVTDAKDKLVKRLADLMLNIIQWFNDLRDDISEWFNEQKTNIKTWWENLFDAKRWATAWSKVITWFNNLKTDVKDWFDDRVQDVKKWWAEQFDTSSWKTAWSHVESWFADFKTEVSTWFNDRINDVKEWWETIFDTSDWVSAWLHVTSWFSDLKTSISNWFSSTKESVKTWWADTFSTDKWSTGWSHVTSWFSDLKTNVSNWFSSTKESVKTWWSDTWSTSAWSTGWSRVTSWFSTLKSDISTWFTNTKSSVKSWWSGVFESSGWSSGWSRVSNWFSTLRTNISEWFSSRRSDVSTWWSNAFNSDNFRSAWSLVSDWFSDLRSSISSWFSNLGTSVSTWWSNLWDDKTATVTSTVAGVASGTVQIGHAAGGIFNREHIARFAEGNKAEAIIPLENRSAMQPFVDAVSDGLTQSLAPIFASGVGTGSNNLPPMYVGTLIADERGLKELYKKFELYEAKELARKGFA